MLHRYLPPPVKILFRPELARPTTCECRDLPEPVLLPGCVPLHGADLLEPLQNRSDPVYRLMIELGRNYLLAEGFIVNTMDALEHETLVAFQELSDKGVYPTAYAVGPFTRRRCPDSDEVKHSCLRWLDNQPDGSVLYVSFGSGGTLSMAQTAELAAGLEASGQRFLWVVHHPNDKDSSAAYLGTAARRWVCLGTSSTPARRVRREDERHRAPCATVGAAGGDP